MTTTLATIPRPGLPGLQLNASTASMQDVAGAGALLVSYVAGTPAGNSSFGRLMRDQDLPAEPEALLRGAASVRTAGGVRLVELPVEASAKFASAFALELPAALRAETLGETYALLKRNAAAILGSGRGGHLALPLIGNNASAGISTDAVLLELHSLVTFVAALPHARAVTVFTSAANVALLRARCGAGVLDGLGADDTPAAVAALSSETAASSELDPVVAEAARLTCEQWAAAGQGSLFAATACLQARRAVEAYCRLLSGSRTVNANAAVLQQLAAAGALPQDVAARAAEAIRNGNKAAHADQAGVLTASDANVALQCMRALLGLRLEQRARAAGPVAVRSAGGGAEWHEGDWACAACGDEHQFARNEVCRRCAAPRPSSPCGGAAAPAAGRPGDWTCVCGDLQFARNVACRQCGAPRPSSAGPSGGSAAAAPAAPAGRPGDWTCVCGDLQFARNVACRQCGAPRPSSSSGGAPAPAAGRPGDWTCVCGDLQFARNVTCRQCGAPRPTAATATATTEKRARVAAAPAPSAPPARPGDWTCVCGDLQFARNVTCRQCGAPRPTAATATAATATVEKRARVAAAPAPPARPGDWTCSCGDVQFARNAACRRCGAPKPRPGLLATLTSFWK